MKNMEKKTYLSKEQTERLAGVFADKKQYEEYMATLCALRELVCVKMDYEMDSTDPKYRIFDLTNRLIGALLDDRVEILCGKIHYKGKGMSRYETDKV